MLIQVKTLHTLTLFSCNTVNRDHPLPGSLGDNKTFLHQCLRAWQIYVVNDPVPGTKQMPYSQLWYKQVLLFLSNATSNAWGQEKTCCKMPEGQEHYFGQMPRVVPWFRVGIERYILLGKSK